MINATNNDVKRMTNATNNDVKRMTQIIDLPFRRPPSSSTDCLTPLYSADILLMASNW